MEYQNIELKKFFKLLYKEILKELKSNPNNKITVKMTLDFNNETNADIEIIVDEKKLVLD